MVLRMVGASARVRSSSLRASRSDSSRAVDSMLRRSWLILLVAAPTSARRDFWRSEARSSRCRFWNSRSTTPISSLPLGRRPLGARLLGRAAEGDHVGRQVLQRPDHQPAQREVEQEGGEQRDDDRQHQDAAGVAVHGDAHRQLVGHDPHHGVGQAHRLAADPDVERTVVAPSPPAHPRSARARLRSLRLKAGMVGLGSMFISARLGLLGSISTTASTRAWLSRVRLTSSVTMLSGVASSASAASVPLSMSWLR